MGPCLEAGSAFQVGRAAGSPLLLLHPGQCEVSTRKACTCQGEGMPGVQEGSESQLGLASEQQNSGLIGGQSPPSVTTEEPALSNPKVLVLLPGVTATGSCW